MGMPNVYTSISSFDVLKRDTEKEKGDCVFKTESYMNRFKIGVASSPPVCTSDAKDTELANSNITYRVVLII